MPAIRSASSAGSPEMLSTLSRAVAPRVIAKTDFGNRHSLASNSMTAALALPSSAGAVTAAFSVPCRAGKRRAPRPRLGAQLDRHAGGGATQEHRIGRTPGQNRAGQT